MRENVQNSLILQEDGEQRAKQTILMRAAETFLFSQSQIGHNLKPPLLMGFYSLSLSFSTTRLSTKSLLIACDCRLTQLSTQKIITIYTVDHFINCNLGNFFCLTAN